MLTFCFFYMVYNIKVGKMSWILDLVMLLCPFCVCLGSVGPESGLAGSCQWAFLLLLSVWLGDMFLYTTMTMPCIHDQTVYSVRIWKDNIWPDLRQGVQLCGQRYKDLTSTVTTNTANQRCRNLAELLNLCSHQSLADQHTVNTSMYMLHISTITLTDTCNIIPKGEFSTSSSFYQNIYIPEHQVKPNF